MENTDIKIEEDAGALKLDLIIPVYKPDVKFKHLIERLKKQKDKPDRIILLQTVEEENDRDSRSTQPGQEYITYAMELEDNNFHIEFIEVGKKDFDHGATRAYGASLSKADLLMFMTQDAVPCDTHLISNMKAAFSDSKIAAAYARQLPREDAGIIESYTRKFNYPEESSTKSLLDLPELGIKTYFCSNVCAAYRREVYEGLGGFVKKTIFNEDMIMAAGIIKAGYSIAYTSEAKVYHSHGYTCKEQFKRNFDLAVSQADFPEVFSGIKSESEGKKMVFKTSAHLIKSGRFYLLPSLIAESGYKYMGYLAGKNYKKLPLSLIKKISMNPSYFNCK
ncbi:glycosyltransferase family 2 protein [Anaerocolumna sp. AGMB13020]|uniref:glycosyltransferase n=1 Tax=Anaerocolumna sp. AGMB13020 TaxID=3081750 RepID=UPI002953E3D9|nr:glycosyltransferase family 2 protein [Anaerocolumna sp. AGMB13020]WOO36168.1 glycosyltransferase family 2 protein [Anaerocolumna sp. AGMB13020]